MKKKKKGGGRIDRELCGKQASSLNCSVTKNHWQVPTVTLFAFCRFVSPHLQSDSHTAKSKLCQQKQKQHKDIASAQDKVLEYLLFICFTQEIKDCKKQLMGRHT